jgi:hypothetical protein
MKTDRDCRVPARDAAAHLYALYEELDRRVDALLSGRPGTRCRRCGACCIFPPGVPVLYATALEHAHLVPEVAVRRAPLPEGACYCLDPDTHLCTARANRPIVCRTHFCDEVLVEGAARLAMQRLDEWAYDELRRISDAHGFEWRHMSITDRR